MSPLEELRAIRAPLDKHLHELSGASLKVLIYIWRRTAGWSKTVDMMTLKQICEGIVTKGGKRLDHGTGLGRRTVLRALEDLEDRGLIAIDRRAGRPSRYCQRGVSRMAPGGVKSGTGTRVTDGTHTVQSSNEQGNTGTSSWGKAVAEKAAR